MDEAAVPETLNDKLFEGFPLGDDSEKIGLAKALTIITLIGDFKLDYIDCLTKYKHIVKAVYYLAYECVENGEETVLRMGDDSDYIVIKYTIPGKVSAKKDGLTTGAVDRVFLYMDAIIPYDSEEAEDVLEKSGLEEYQQIYHPAFATYQIDNTVVAAIDASDTTTTTLIFPLDDYGLPLNCASTDTFFEDDNANEPAQKTKSTSRHHISLYAYLKYIKSLNAPTTA
jgi:hypothetical protein